MYLDVLRVLAAMLLCFICSGRCCSTVRTSSRSSTEMHTRHQPVCGSRLCCKCVYCNRLQLCFCAVQVWADAAAQSGHPLSPEEKWQLGTKLIADSGDHVSAARVFAETNNYYRLMRVLEIVLHTGKTLADFEPEQATPHDYDFR